MTAYTITELLPVAQYSALGYTPPNEQTPAVFGSVSDSSDATFTTLEAEYQPGGARYSEVLTLDFALADPTVLPQFMHMRMRVRDNAEFVADPGAFVTIFTDYSLVADAPGSPYDEWAASSGTIETGAQLADLATAQVADATWLDFAYVGTADPVDTANPSADTWFEVNPDGMWIPYQHATGLAGSGIRFTIYPRADSNLDPRLAYLDIFEVRMVLAYAIPSAGRVPPLRLHPRSDGRGMSSAQRVWPRPPTGAYGRIGPGSLI